MGGHQVFGLAALGLMVALGLGAVGINHLTAAWHEIEATLPPTPQLATLPVSTVVVDRRGGLLRPFTTADGRWRLPVTMNQVDRRLIDMLVAYEDKRFFDNGGVDWTSMVRAAGQFVLAGGPGLSGGSTRAPEGGAPI